mmetsp:Transcript_39168/g.129681  ORF Transcript_39168/g.129681 Transcript_39168/m.129681 type:complete len:204 (+) Transcript_39168:1663-2274(+)
MIGAKRSRACCGRGECSASERSAAQDVDSRGTKSSWSRRPSVRIAGWTRSSGILPTLPVCNSSAPVRPGNTTAPPPRSGAPTSAATISQQVRLRWKEESERTCSDGTTFDLCCANSQRPRRTSKAHRSIRWRSSCRIASAKVAGRSRYSALPLTCLGKASSAGERQSEMPPRTHGAPRPCSSPSARGGAASAAIALAQPGTSG